MITAHGRLAEADLIALRQKEAQAEAVKINPRAYSAAETERFLIDYYRHVGDLAIKYDVDTALDWHISHYTGDIWYNS